MVFRITWPALLTGMACWMPMCVDRSDDAAVVALSVTSPDRTIVPADPELSIRIYVRAITADGTSTDVTDRATCTLTAQDPPGELVGMVFHPTKPGVTTVECTFAGVSAGLAITVQGSLETTIARVQQRSYLQGTAVSTKAVVFALNPDGEYLDFYGQDPGGGPYSGVLFRDSRKPENHAADAGVPPLDLRVGDVVTVEGEYTERNGHSSIDFVKLVKVGTEPLVVSVVRLQDLDPEVWEGCFVEVDEVVVSNPSVDAYYFEVTDAKTPGPTLLVDNEYAPAVVAGTAFDSIRGTFYVSESISAGALLPREASDLVVAQ